MEELRLKNWRNKPEIYDIPMDDILKYSSKNFYTRFTS